MTVVDLTTSPLPAPAALLDGLPRRVGLTLPELRHASALAGGAPLPFDHPSDRAAPAPPVLAPPVLAPADRLGDRLGGATDTAATAYDDLLRALPDPGDSLVRRGLVTAGSLDAGLAGALGLLATPRLALDLDVVVGHDRLRSWQRQRDEAVATLATADGLVFELAWCHTSQWAQELTRAATVLAGDEAGATGLPDRVRLPFELADAAAEATAAGRGDVLPALLAQTGPVTDPAGEALPAAEAHAVLAALTAPCRGRLRALATEVSHPTGLPVATVSWLLLGDGWRALEPVPGAPGLLQLRRVAAADLAASLAPALAVVSS